MRKLITEKTVYTWQELNDEQKQKALEKLWDLNVDHDWWDATYEDAERIGLKITEFDLDRASYVRGEFFQDSLGVADAIFKEHGDNCETYKTAKNYLAEYYKLYADQDAELLAYPGSARDWDALLEEPWEPEGLENLNDEFLKSLCEDYRIILQNEYEYLTSEEAIIESIEANEYEFDEEGNLI